MARIVTNPHVGVNQGKNKITSRIKSAVKATGNNLVGVSTTAGSAAAVKYQKTKSVTKAVGVSYQILRKIYW